MSTNVNLGWHFAAIVDEKPVLRDGRPLIVGEWLEHTGPAVICHSGLHLSVKALDALKYAPGPFVTRVEYADVRDIQDDKLVCTRRRPVYGYDATAVLRAWARKVASDVLHLWDAPQAVVDFLRTGRGAAGALDALYALLAAGRGGAAAVAAYYAADIVFAVCTVAYTSYQTALRARDAAYARYAAYARDAAYARYLPRAVPPSPVEPTKYNTWLEESLEAGRSAEAENVG